MSQPAAHHPFPRAICPGGLFSNGRFHLAVSATGTGQAKRDWIALNRWAADPVEDAHGFFIYLQDLESGETWSVGATPAGETGSQYEATSRDGAFTISHENRGIAATLEITVSPSDDVEVRRLRLRDTRGRPRRIAVISYIEVALNHPAGDAAHPAFSKLFVQTETLPERCLLLARRRPRANHETWPCMFHAIVGAREISWETDRLRFLGRGRGPDRPVALLSGAQLSGTVGNVLDPVLALRADLRISAGQTAEISFLQGAADDRAAAMDVAQRLASAESIRALFAAAAAAERALLERSSVSPGDSAVFQALGVAILRGDRALRAKPGGLHPDADIRATVAKLGIPDDRPLVLSTAGWSHPITATILQARAHWAARGLHVNLAIVSDVPIGRPADLDDRVFLLARAGTPAGEIAALAATAHWVATDGVPDIVQPQCAPPPLSAPRAAPAPPKSDGPLEFWNGFGGFSSDGAEYVIRMPFRDGGSVLPPLPWINVVANEHCGFLISESGAGYTWCRNSQGNRLTPWGNDPVSDPHGEALYIRDDADGSFWSPTPGPAPAPCHYEARHGFGYSVISCEHRDLLFETTAFVPRGATAKCVRLHISNRGAGQRILSVFSYARLVMGSLPSPVPAIVTRHDPADGVLTATNCAASDFRGGAAFSSVAISGAVAGPRHFTCDRHEFIGPGGSPARPAALTRPGPLGGATGEALDPCFAHQIQLQLGPGESAECAFLLGECMSDAEAHRLAARYPDASAIDAALDETRAFWRALTSSVRVRTPSPAIDLMLNGWLLYQNLSCRIWGRSAFYQSGGAYGYRDQLQDTAALASIRPDITREQILLHAAHQFPEGDVLHWWHPEPMETGMRTRFSDDLLWLPYVTAHYISTTGDASVLDEARPFVTAPLLDPGQDEVYLKPGVSTEAADIYEHCCRAIDRSLTRGSHGLPLMGTGDWNDGMNRIGREGRGESVWLGFFLHHVLDQFLPLCEARLDSRRADAYRAYRARLATALNEAGWDGDWYRRAYYDDGTPLGSTQNDECRIDALAQAWAVISGVAPSERAQRAMGSLARELVSERDGLIRLLAPPFADTPKDPGYIKGYVAGVRENGGQYTHAAAWVIRAFAEHGDHDRAARLLEMVMPVTRAKGREAAETYKVEPFVIAADVYGAPPHVGRGGWTWYTGSAGWMFRVALESILGLHFEHGDRLAIRPRIPDHWPGYQIDYRTPAGATIRIAVENPSGRPSRIVDAALDGQTLSPEVVSSGIPLPREGTHSITITLGDR